MKRFLSTISLLLTVAMLASFVAPLSVLAADTAPVSYGTDADVALNSDGKVKVSYATKLSGNSTDNLAKVDGIFDPNDPWYNYGITTVGVSGVGTILAKNDDNTPNTALVNAVTSKIKTTYYYAQDDKYIYVAYYSEFGKYDDKYVTYLDYTTYLGFGGDSATGAGRWVGNFSLMNSSTSVSEPTKYTNVGCVADKIGTGYTDDYSFYYEEFAFEKAAISDWDSLSFGFIIWNLNYGTSASATTIAQQVKFESPVNGTTYYNFAIFDEKNGSATELGHTMTNKFLAQETESATTYYHSQKVANDQWDIINPTKFSINKNANPEEDVTCQTCGTVLIPGVKYNKAAAFALDNSDKLNVIYAPKLSSNSADNYAKIDGLISPDDPWYNNYTYTVEGKDVMKIWAGQETDTALIKTLINGMSTDYHYTQDEEYIYIAIATHVNAQTYNGVKYVPHIEKEYFYFGLNNGLNVGSAIVSEDTFRNSGESTVTVVPPNQDLNGYGTIEKIVTSRYTPDGLLITTGGGYVIAKDVNGYKRQFVKDSYILYREIVIKKNPDNPPSTLSISLDLNTIDYLPELNNQNNRVTLGYDFLFSGSNITGETELIAAAKNAGNTVSDSGGISRVNDLVILDDKNTDATSLGHTMTDKFLVEETGNVATFYHSKSIADGQWNIVAPGTYEATNNGDGTYTRLTTIKYDDNYHWDACSCGVANEKIPNVYGKSAAFALNNNDKVNVIYAPKLSGDSAANLAKIDGKLDANDPWYNSAFAVSGDETYLFYPGTANGLNNNINTKYYYTQDDNYVYVAIASHIKVTDDGKMPYLNEYRYYLGTDLNDSAKESYNSVSLYPWFTTGWRDEFNDKVDDSGFALIDASGIYRNAEGVYKHTGGYTNDQFVNDSIYISRYDANGNLINDSVLYKSEYVVYQEFALDKTQLSDGFFFRFWANTLAYVEASSVNKVNSIAWHFNGNGTNVTNDADFKAAAIDAGITLNATNNISYFPDLIILDSGMSEENIGHTLDSKFLAGEGSTEGTANLYHSIAIKKADGQADWNIIYPATFVANDTAEGYTFSDASYAFEVKYDVTLTDSDLDKAYSCEYDGFYFKSCSCGDIGEGSECSFTVPALKHDEETVRYNSDREVHWFECDVCKGIGVEKTAHDFSLMDEIEDYLVNGSVATCLKGADYYKHCVCGLASEETFEGSTADLSLHNYTNEYYYNDGYHWNECEVCGATNAISRHIFASGRCILCDCVAKVAPAPSTPETEAPTTEAPVTEAPATEAPETEAPGTEAPVTEEPATEAPATEASATEAPVTEAPVTEEPATNEGCNGAISLAGMAIVAMLGTCAVFATKKKED